MAAPVAEVITDLAEKLADAHARIEQLERALCTIKALQCGCQDADGRNLPVQWRQPMVGKGRYTNWRTYPSSGEIVDSEDLENVLRKTYGCNPELVADEGVVPNI